MEITTYTEIYTNLDKPYDLYVAHPKEQDKPLPAIFIAHAWDGLNKPVKEIAHRVAKLGYIAIAVDVYGKGIRGNPTGDNSNLMNPLIENREVLKNQLLAGLEAIKNLSFVDSTKLGAIGYCFGGLCVLDLARAAPENLLGVVSFHGLLGESDAHDTTPIQASILVEHGWDDPMVSAKDVIAFASEMDKRKADWQLHAHGGAVHAFTFEGANMPEKGIQYHQAAAERSWQSMNNFFEEVFV